MGLGFQIATLFILAIPIASVGWTITHEEVYREPREFCQDRSHGGRRWYQRKFFYLFTLRILFQPLCSAFSRRHRPIQLLFTGWRGYLAAFFASVWIANPYMNIFGRLRLDIKGQRVEIAAQERELENRRRQ